VKSPERDSKSGINLQPREERPEKMGRVSRDPAHNKQIMPERIRQDFDLTVFMVTLFSSAGHRKSAKVFKFLEELVTETQRKHL
jgi:hypothetical protein